MTYLEWMTSTVARFNVTADEAELILTNQSELVPDMSATVDVAIAKTALCKELSYILPVANVTEGGYSVSWDMNAIKAYYRALCAELGMQDLTQPQIRNRSNIW